MEMRRNEKWCAKWSFMVLNGKEMRKLGWEQQFEKFRLWQLWQIIMKGKAVNGAHLEIAFGKHWNNRVVMVNRLLRQLSIHKIFGQISLLIIFRMTNVTHQLKHAGQSKTSRRCHFAVHVPAFTLLEMPRPTNNLLSLHFPAHSING